MNAATRQPAETPLDFVIARHFDVPRDLMFKLWTEREHLAQWFGPQGVTIVKCTNDLRPGGVMHYGMQTPDGSVMWGKWVYREIARPNRLIFIVSFSDEAGGITRHPFSAGWPLETLSTVTFEEREGGTDTAVIWIAHNATELERKTFDAGQESMQEDWTGTFEQLSDYLPKCCVRNRPIYSSNH